MSEWRRLLAAGITILSACEAAPRPTAAPPRRVDLATVLAHPSDYQNQLVLIEDALLVCIRSTSTTTKVTMPGFEDYPMGMGQVEITDYDTRYGLVPDPTSPAYRLEMTGRNEEPRIKPCNDKTISTTTFNATGVVRIQPNPYLETYSLTEAQ